MQAPLPLNGQPQAYGLPPGEVFPLGGMVPHVGHPQMGQPLTGSTGPMGFQGIYPQNAAAQQQVDLLAFYGVQSTIKCCHIFYNKHTH